GWKNHLSALLDWSCRDCASLTNARHSAVAALQTARRVRRWFPRREHARLTIILEGEKEMAIALSCPLPRPATDRIVLAHGGGGRLSNQLVESVFVPAFRNPALQLRHDGAVLCENGTRLALSTDTYVVNPLIFPGGTIGNLAINGTVNDLAMCGARPLALS